ncbi:CPA2 family monovalent cation:H+ antiporter-2 [Rhodoligotrophos appendicifer]|nr:YbaL family putative K(+) efflux transporter [Rhodoligotrophos appendicifer]
MHSSPLISTLVGGIVLAFLLGALANRLRISPLVGYLLAGILAGPFTPGFVADLDLATQLAEIGVILLMFGVGLHFSLKDLLSVRAIAIPGALAQIAFATLLGLGLGLLMGWKIGAGLVFGLALSVASTVVLLRALQERRLLDNEKGRIAVGWLIVEDLAMVLTLVLLPAVSGLLISVDDPNSNLVMGGSRSIDILQTVAITLGKVAAFVALMLIVGRRVIPWVLHRIAHMGSRELFRLAVLAIALGVAYGATTLFGVSFALGAFFAGMVLSESELSQRAAEETLPLRDAFAVLFFVSVGMLFDPSILLRDPGPVIATVLIIVIGKSVAAFFIVRLFGYTVGTSLIISASLAQIGEFSFILASLGVSLQVLPPEGRNLILAGAILSILLNPLFFAAIEKWRPLLEAKFERKPEQGAPGIAVIEPEISEPPLRQLPITGLSDHAVLIGYGRVGSIVGEALVAQAKAVLVIEERDEEVKILRERGMEAISGNAAASELIRAANLEGAKWLIVAIPHSFEAGQIIEQARKINPELQIIARAHSDAEVEHLRQHGADCVIMGEREIADAMISYVADTTDRPDALRNPISTGGNPASEATQPLEDQHRSI